MIIKQLKINKNNNIEFNNFLSNSISIVNIEYNNLVEH